MFRNLDIGRKVALVLWGTTLVFFGVAAGFLMLTHGRTLEQRAEATMTPYARLISVSIMAAVELGDRARVNEILETLRANPDFEAGYVVIADGRWLASYRRTPAVADAPPPAKLPGIHLDDGRAELVQLLTKGNGVVGRLHLVMDTVSLRKQAWRSLLPFGLGLGALLAAALVQSLMLQRVLVQPLLSLAGLAGRIREGDYDVPRAVVQSQDEVGRLGRAFNDMLDAVQQRTRDLQQKSAELEGYFNHSLDLFCVADVQGHFRRLNQAWETTLGYSVSELVGKPFLDLVHPDDREATMHALARLGRQEEVLNFVNRYRCEDGSYRWIEWRSFPSGKLVYAAARDITERRQAEEKLRESEERFRRLFDGAADAYFLHDEAGRLLDVNQAACESLGYSRAELLNLTVSQIECSLQPPVLDRLWQQIRAEHSAMVEGVHRCRDGSTFPVEVRIITFAHGHHPSYFASARDITKRQQAEAALREKEEWFRTVFENAGDGLFFLSHGGEIELVNESFAAMHGYRVAEILEMNLRELDSPETQRLFPERMARILTGESLTFEVEHYHKNGQLFPLEVTANVVTVGGVEHVLASHRDITDRKRAEEAAVRERELLRTLIDLLPDGIYLKDRDSRFLMANQALVERLGKSSLAEVIGLSDVDLFPSSLAGVFRADEERVLDGQTVREQEENVPFPNGQGRIILTTKVPLHNKQGQVTGLVGIGRDITERKQAEVALRESEQKFRALFEHMAEGVALHEVIHDPQGQATDYRLLDMNPAYAKHTGLDVVTVRGRLASEVYGTGAAPYLREWAEVARTGKPHVMEVYHAPLARHFHISAICPKPGFFATVFEDVTERIRKEEELRRKNEELERFTYTVSHDLKSPLITIKGFAGALLHDLEAGRTQRLSGDLRRITDAAGKMTELLNDLLELSRIGRIAYPPSDFAMGVLVREVQELLAGPIAQHHAELVVHPDLPVVRGDRQRLREVVQNLVENALKFMGPQASPRIEIGSRMDPEGRVFFVRDNGMGIDPRYQETVFGLFNQLDVKAEGTGIGLALVRRIIEVHGGRIWVESAGAGQGTSFCFTLPRGEKLSQDLPP